MDKTVEPKAASKAKKLFDLSALTPLDEAEMVVAANGQATDWKWRFAGPAHPMGIAQKRRLHTEQHKIDQEIRSARVNNRRWVAPTETPEEVLERNVNFVMERLLGWSEVTHGGKPFPFSRDSARELLSDPRTESLLVQALEFLAGDGSFHRKDV